MIPTAMFIVAVVVTNQTSYFRRFHLILHLPGLPWRYVQFPFVLSSQVFDPLLYINNTPCFPIVMCFQQTQNPESGFSTSGDGTERLKTRVWHAKRFTMIKCWGFHLPLCLHER